MGELIKLNSISNHNNYLKQLSRKDGGKSNTYALIADVPTIEIRLSKTLRTINWIDAPGGPRIVVGEQVRGLSLGKVKYIDYVKNYGYVITFEDDLLCDQSNETSES